MLFIIYDLTGVCEEGAGTGDRGLVAIMNKRRTIIKERRGIGAHQSDLMGHLTRSSRVKRHNVPDLAK